MIIKKNSKRLYYSEFINYFIRKGILNYKFVDSELEAAMDKFIRHYMRNDDI